VEMGVNHSIHGNPNRFSQGVVTLKPDDEWTMTMRSKDRALVTALTWPLLKAYGYGRGQNEPRTITALAGGSKPR
jgi:hypothetical protein